jgi:hypothetical protein
MSSKGQERLGHPIETGLDAAEVKRGCYEDHVDNSLSRISL